MDHLVLRIIQENYLLYCKKNKFNLINATKRDCTNDSNEKIWTGDCSYIKAVKWVDFINNIDKYIDEAYERLDNINDYNICKEI